MRAASVIRVSRHASQEGDVVHLVANTVTDLSAELASVGNRNEPLPLPHGRADEAHGGPAIDPRSLPKGFRRRDLVDPILKVDRIQKKTRDFR
ncbi:MAG: DNA polymerase [Mesorhizobium sp.]|nr:MAG: DNA polymerase [Mesorhizobium sp.]